MRHIICDKCGHVAPDALRVVVGVLNYDVCATCAKALRGWLRPTPPAVPVMPVVPAVPPLAKKRTKTDPSLGNRSGRWQAGTRSA